ncbi:MAG: amidohydrolase [Chloroflexi bacterium]|nr:amidohydrolase [Chloroflexota bacterium]
MIIDFRITPPKPEWTDITDYPEYVRNYYRVYKDIKKNIGLTVEDVLRRMKEGGVDRSVMQAEWGYGDWRKQNDAVHRLVNKYPDKFIGMATVHPSDDVDMDKVVEREVKERGFKGINIQPWALHHRASEKLFYPMYKKCEELGVPVTIHSAINFSKDRCIDYGRPLYLCEVACDFPDLKIVANHGGWPWVTELVAVAWKHANVYIEIGGIAPKYIGMPGTGWEPLMVYGNSLLQDKILYASDTIVNPKRGVEELKALPLKEEVKRKWLGENAARLLGL